MLHALTPIRKIGWDARRIQLSHMKFTRSIARISTAGITDSKQLSNLDSVLNGLDQGASKMTQKCQELMRAVRSGTYEVDAVQVSRCIIGHTLGSA